MRLAIAICAVGVAWSAPAGAADAGWVSLGRIMAPNVVTFVSAAPSQVGARVHLDQLAISTDDEGEPGAGLFRLSVDCAAGSLQVLGYEGVSRHPSRRDVLGWWRASALVEAPPRTDLTQGERAIVRYACEAHEARQTYAGFAAAHDAVTARPQDF